MFKKVIISSIVVLGLAGCGGTMSNAIVAPTNSSAVAPAAQKKAIIAWASACESYDNIKVGLATAINAKDVNVLKSATKIKTIENSIDPLCESFPANPSVATSNILSSVITLRALLPSSSNVTVKPVTTTSTKK